MHKRRVAVYEVVVLVLCIKFGHRNAVHDPEWVKPPQITDFNNYMMEYTLYERAVTWNDAVRICASNQSHVLSLNTREKVDLVEEFKLNKWRSLKSNDYWSGLAEPAPRYFIWEDCTLLSNFQMFKGESYNSAELCYKVKKDTLLWESRHCNDKYYFACEKVIPGDCNEATTLSSNNLVMLPNMSAESCKLNCTQRDTCWSGISMNTGLCILLVSRTGTEPFNDVTMFKKICIKESLVLYSQVILPIPENKSQQPLLNCSSIPQQTDSPDVTTGIDDTTPEQEISPSPCLQYETVNETQTVMITETIFCSAASCSNGSYRYLSTDDPVLIEEIASMKQELTVDKRETNCYQRTLISAPDQRPSSKVIGSVGICIIVVPLLLIFLSDAPTLIRGCRSFIRRCRRPAIHRMNTIEHIYR